MNDTPLAFRLGSQNAAFGMIQAPPGAEKGKLFLERATRSCERNKNTRCFPDTQSSSDRDHALISHVISKRRRSAGHCDFIDKQAKLFTAQHAVSLTPKMLDKITGGLRNAVLDWNLKCRFNFPISRPSQISILSAIPARISQRIHGRPFQKSLGFVSCTEQSFRRSLWHWKRVRGVKKHAPREPALKRADLTHVPLNREKSLVNTSMQANDPNMLRYRHQRRRQLPDFIASQLMCRVSTRC